MQPPKRLSKRARAKYRELAPHLSLHTPLLVETLAQYCETWEQYIRAGEELSRLTSVGTTSTASGAPAAAITVQHKCLDQMRRLLKVLCSQVEEPKRSIAEELHL